MEEQKVNNQPVYNLSVASTQVSEGDTVVFTLNTQNVADGTTVPYTITGIQSTDIDIPLAGNFTVNSNTDSITAILALDNFLENQETLVMTLDGLGVSLSVDIEDISKGTPTYTLTADKETMLEGETVVFTLDTTGIQDGVEIPFTITGVQASDIDAPLNGVFIVQNNTATLPITAIDDGISELTEGLFLKLDGLEVQQSVRISDR